MSDGANSRPRSWIGAVALLILFTSGLFAQDSPFRLKVDVSLIPIDVAVYDASGKPVSGLPADDFVVLEDGEPQPIQHFEPVDAAYNTLLLFDVSGSTENQRPFMIEAANRFLANIRPADSVAIASFDSVVTRLMDWRT